MGRKCFGKMFCGNKKHVEQLGETPQLHDRVQVRFFFEIFRGTQKFSRDENSVKLCFFIFFNPQKLSIFHNRPPRWMVKWPGRRGISFCKHQSYLCGDLTGAGAPLLQSPGFEMSADLVWRNFPKPPNFLSNIKHQNLLHK